MYIRVFKNEDNYTIQILRFPKYDNLVAFIFNCYKKLQVSLGKSLAVFLELLQLASFTIKTIIPGCGMHPTNTNKFGQVEHDCLYLSTQDHILTGSVAIGDTLSSWHHDYSILWVFVYSI